MAVGAGSSSAGSGRKLLSTQVRERVLNWIAGGMLAPGSRLIETNLARELGTSQAPVREALRDLAAMGVVETRVYRGSCIRQPDSQELRDAVLVRAELERLAGRLAAPRITQTYLRRLEQLVVEMTAAAADGDIDRYASRHTEFHRTIVSAAGNRHLERLWEMLDSFLMSYIPAPRADTNLEWQGRRHRVALKALRDHDPDEAGTIARSRVLAFTV
jgi:DNA-binding GntR family transcriptional regulator